MRTTMAGHSGHSVSIAPQGWPPNILFIVHADVMHMSCGLQTLYMGSHETCLESRIVYMVASRYSLVAAPRRSTTVEGTKRKVSGGARKEVHTSKTTAIEDSSPTWMRTLYELKAKKTEEHQDLLPLYKH